MNSIRTVLMCVFTIALLAGGGGVPVFAESDADVKVKTPIVKTVNINKDDAGTLAAVLHGIGLAKAEAIVKYREENGLFTDKQQLLNVKGIGEATLKKNEALISL